MAVVVVVVGEHASFVSLYRYLWLATSQMSVLVSVRPKTLQKGGL